MTTKSVDNVDSITKKCGEITITMKKNAKNVFSFNCWFCDTIYVHVKKFTLHMEQEHVDQLEEPATNIYDTCNEDDLLVKMDVQKESVIDSLFIPEIKIEDCDNTDIKSEIEEEKSQIVTRFRKKEELSLKFEDPLETVKSNDNKITLPQEEQSILKVDNELLFKNEMEVEDVEMDNNSDDEHSEDDSDYSGDDGDDSEVSDSDSKIGEGSANETANELAKSSKTNKKANEKELILALIEAYQQNPQLWSKSQKEKKYNSKQKDELLQKIAEDLNVKLNLKLKLFSVKTKLNVICKQYEKVIKKEMDKKEDDNENEQTNDKESSGLWYYDNLSFLRTTVENKIKNKRTITYHKVKPLSHSEFCEVLDIYKNHNSLWDIHDIAYTIKQKRKENMQLLLEDIQKNSDIPLDLDKLGKHIKFIHNEYSKDKQLRLECELAQKEFKPKCSFYDKCKFLEDHQGPFKCETCNKIILPYKDFLIHKSEHDGTFPFVCKKCGTGFKASGNYTIHVKRHLQVFRFTCKICGKGYPVNAELDLHMRKHTGALPYLCSLCGEGFRTAHGYDNHIRRHEQRFRYYCHICQKGFNVLTFLNDHVRAHLNVRDIICTICGKGFTSKKYLIYHRRIHGSKNYTCNICGKSYAQDAGLRQHKKSHGTPIGHKKPSS